MKSRDNSLLGILTFSEKRKDILFFLQESPKTLSQIKDHLKVSKDNFKVGTSEILPRITELVSANMIEKNEDRYQLTPFGEAVLIDFKPFLDTISGIEANEMFWKTHDVSGIPEHLIHRIKELKYCKVDHVHDSEMFESHDDFIISVSNAKSFKGGACVFNPGWVNMFLELSATGAHIELILTSKVFQKFKNYDTLKFEIMLENGMQIYICDDIKSSFAVTDPIYFSFGLYLKKGQYNKKGQYDNIQDLFGYDSLSAKWGSDLFEYYKNQSEKIKVFEVVKDHTQCLQKLIV